MCGLCGTLGAPDHWTGAVVPDGATPRADRLGRVRAVNRVLACVAMRVDDWQGSAFVLSSATGAQEIVTDLQAIWAAVERTRGSAIDPLSDAVLGRL